MILSTAPSSLCLVPVLYCRDSESWGSAQPADSAQNIKQPTRAVRDGIVTVLRLFKAMCMATSWLGNSLKSNILLFNNVLNNKVTIYRRGRAKMIS